MHLQSLPLKCCWCQMATLKMKVKNTGSAKNVVVRRLTEQSATVKPVIILYEAGRNVVRRVVIQQYRALWNMRTRKDIWSTHIWLTAMKSYSFITNLDISLPECSDLALVAIKKKLPWYHMPPNHGICPASDYSRKHIPVNRQCDLLQ